MKSMGTRAQFREENKNDPLLLRIAESIWEEQDAGKKVGFDLAKHWKSMMDSLDKEAEKA